MTEQELTKDQQLYQVSSDRYENLAEKLLKKRGDTLILSGFGCSLNIRLDALHVYPGKTHISQKQPLIVLYRGIHSILNILLLETSGYISLDAIRWCKDEGITITAVDFNGELLAAIGDGKSDVKLRLLQYEVYSNTKLRGTIACSFVAHKIKAQLETLKLCPTKSLVPQDKFRAIEVFNDAIKWLDMEELPERFYNIDWLMSYESRCAQAYWEVFRNILLHWSRSDRKLVPPHFLVIGERTSLSTKSDNARHATSIFHAALNYAYAVLKRQCLQPINSVGLDPEVSFLHAPHDHRFSLALDLMEPFRPLVDALVLEFFGKEKLKRSILMRTEDGSIRFQPQFLRYFIVRNQLSQESIDEAARDLKTAITDVR